MSGKMKEMYAEALERGGEEEVKRLQALMDQEGKRAEEETEGRDRETFTERA